MNPPTTRPDVASIAQGPQWSGFAGYIVAAVGCAALSMCFAAMVQRRVLRAGGFQIGVRSMLGIAMASNAITVTLPFAGSSAGTGYTYRQIRRRGADPQLATWALTVSGLISWSLISALLGVSIATTGNDNTACAAGVLMLGLLVAIVAMRHPRPRAKSARLIQTLLNHLPIRRRATRVAPIDVADVFESIAALKLGKRAAASTFGLSAGNWVADIACLSVCVLATGHPIPWTDLAFIYAATLGAASMSFTPAGLGIVEGAIAISLTRAGIHPADAVTASILYRAISCWLVLVLGWIGYASIRRRSQSPTHMAAPIGSDSTLIGPAAPLVQRVIAQPDETVRLRRLKLALNNSPCSDPSTI
jgi:putative heme transporter